ncbi:hypothetical protein Droror1_Dr00017734 [Drosera rotundifolia]
MACLGSHDDPVLPINSTIVAIDKDKNSQYAVRWAVDHLLTTTQLIILVHVRHKNFQYQVPGVVDVSSTGSTDADVQQLFMPYRGYCARKSIQLKEVILEDADVAKALVDYINSNCIANVVVGASSRNALLKTFKKFDVPSSMTKSAPDFCSVYVIAKGKVISVRSAQRPLANTAAPPKLTASFGLPHQLSADHASLDGGARSTGFPAGLQATGSERYYLERGIDSVRGSARPRPYSGSRNSPTNMSLENIDIVSRPCGSSARCSFSDEENEDQLGSRSMDMTAQNLDFSIPGSGKIPGNSNDVEAEMRRLRLELKQTMDMYSTACKEAISAKQKAKELSEWKLEEARKFEQARLAEEAALAIAEMEKAKCKAAIEAAQAAQKLAEMEAQKRRLAELKAKREAEENDRALTALAHQDVRYRKYSIDEIEAATEKFSPKLKIGEGGYGPVYKGKLDHTPVAIKVLRPDAAQGRKQFQQEVEVLSCIRHPHMVLLLGACPEYGCLVYEFMNNGSLEDRLFRRGNTRPIPLRLRFKIAAEIATALTFLHQTKPEPLVHRDLKPANILLDRNYVSKISDVGLARLVPPSVANSVTQYHMTSAAGTFCYIDPEYQQTGMLTTKSDIYSLGIMLLQIITAKPPMGLSHHVQRAIDKGTFEEMLDPTVMDWPVEEALSFARMALKCAELRKKDRPSLAEVVLPELNRLKEIGLGGDIPNIIPYNPM